MTYLDLATEPPTEIATLLAAPEPFLYGWLTDARYRRGYLIITRSQKLESEALGLLPHGALDRIEQALLASPRFTVLYHDADASRVHRRAPRPGDTTVTRSWPALVASTVVVLAVVAANRHWAVATVAVLWFMCIAPGTAFTRLLRFTPDGAAGWAVAVAVSLALDALCNEAMIYAHIWTPTRGLLALTLLTLGLVGAERAVSR